MANLKPLPIELLKKNPHRVGVLHIETGNPSNQPGKELSRLKIDLAVIFHHFHFLLLHIVSTLLLTLALIAIVFLHASLISKLLWALNNVRVIFVAGRAATSNHCRNYSHENYFVHCLYLLFNHSIT